MPIFEYVCGKCHLRFERLVLRPSQRPKCPQCASMKLERQVEAFVQGRAAQKPRSLNSDSVIAHARALLGNIPTIPRHKTSDLGSPGRRSRRSTVA
jgi:putative FmdB family regulatory protein